MDTSYAGINQHTVAGTGPRADGPPEQAEHSAVVAMGAFIIHAGAWLNPKTGGWQPKFTVRRAGDDAERFPWFLNKSYADSAAALDAAVAEAEGIVRYWQRSESGMRR